MNNSRASLLFARAKYVIQNEGVTAFVRQGFSFIRYQLFFYRTYYLYEKVLKDTVVTEDAPQIQDCTVKMISTNREVAESAAEGLDFRPWYPTYRERLDKGAIAFCVFVGRELGHISWCALTEEALKSLGEPPIKVAFANNESANGGYWTNPKHRGKGLAHFATVNRQRYARDSGKVVDRGAIARDNTASQRVPRSGRSPIYAEARHLKILWWQSWKETPID